MEIIFLYYKKMENKIEIIYNGWDETDPTTNGKCRQRYLEYLKENYPDDWCLVLDEDEIVEDITKIKKFIQNSIQDIFSVKMRHFIGDIGHEDATVPIHFVPNRLFKISKAKSYPLHSHPILQGVEGSQEGMCADTIIWHLGHLPVLYLDYILKRYKQHANDSVVHNQQFLKQWKMSHLLGLYPNKQINPLELPKQICDRYEIDKDIFYFAPRQQLDIKHIVMIRNWLDYSNAKSILDFGCGFGLYGMAANLINSNIKYTGVEISKYVGDNWNDNLGELINEDMRNVSINKPFDLVLFVDILEHLPYEDLDKVLEGESKRDSKFIFSIPFLNDPNLETDSTHIIKEEKQWWIEKLSKYFIIKEAPQHWLFNKQILIGEKK